MPLFILDGEEAEPPPSPPWGSLALDIYLLAEWDFDSTAAEPPSHQRSRLIHQFLKLGSLGRQPYQSQRSNPPKPQPTESQVNDILRPSRPEALRPFAEYTGSLDEGLYLRLCYEKGKEGAHEAIWESNLSCVFVGPDGIVFDDEHIFGSGSGSGSGSGAQGDTKEEMDLSEFLELFPERVTNAGGVGHVESREGALRGCLERIQEAQDIDYEGEEKYFREIQLFVSEQRGGNKDPELLLQYAEYHAACVVTHLFIEDAETLNGKGLLHVFLDDTGDIVRQWRTDESGDEFDFDGSWKEGAWKEQFETRRGVLGDTYKEGGVRGPPYLLS